MLRSGLLAAAVLSTVIFATPIHRRQTSCSAGVHIIHARGSTETIEEDRTLAVVDLITSAIPDSSAQAVDYPAVIIADDGFYSTSVAEGIDDTKSKIKAYVDACGDASRIVLLGYSQGGNVVTSTLAGGLVSLIPLNPMYKKYIKAVAVFGDPTHTAGQDYSAGDANGNGIFRRIWPSTTLLNSYAVRSYCAEGDFFCDQGGNLDVHYAEVDTYGQDAADWIVGLVTQ